MQIPAFDLTPEILNVLESVEREISQVKKVVVLFDNIVYVRHHLFVHFLNGFEVPCVFGGPKRNPTANILVSEVGIGSEEYFLFCV